MACSNSDGRGGLRDGTAGAGAGVATTGGVGGGGLTGTAGSPGSGGSAGAAGRAAASGPWVMGYWAVWQTTQYPLAHVAWSDMTHAAISFV